MKIKEGKSITLLLAMMLILMNLFAVPAWAAPGDVAINEANFPDANFRSYVSTNFDKDSNGVLSQGELDAVKDISVNEKNITTLKGVEHFANLLHLYCDSNQLTALDVTKNSKLSRLDCNSNQLTALDVTKNPELYRLYCVSNQLTALDVTKNPILQDLICSNNQLTALDVTKNSKLMMLTCSENQLTALDLTKNPMLCVLICKNNQLTSLDLTGRYFYDTDFSGHSQKYNIEVSKSDLTFDLSSLPGSFDPSKASEWQGGTVSGNTLTLNDANTNKVTYKYNTNTKYNAPTVTRDILIEVTLKVKYEGEVIISFNPGDGSGSMADVKVDKDSNYSLPACKFTAPAGKEFKAWEVGGVEKAVGDSITVNADTKVKALWKDKAVTPGTNPSDNPMTRELDVMTESQNDINTLAKGNQLTYIVGKSTKAVFRILGEDLGVEDLKSVLLDGTLVDASNYDVSKGSIIVSFKKSYADSLSPGTHEITFNTTKGVAKAELVVKQKTQTSTNITKTSNAQPNTGDNTMLYVHTLGLLMAASGMLILNARRNKKEQ